MRWYAFVAVFAYHIIKVYRILKLLLIVDLFIIKFSSYQHQLCMRV